MNISKERMDKINNTIIIQRFMLWFTFFVNAAFWWLLGWYQYNILRMNTAIFLIGVVVSSTINDIEVTYNWWRKK